MPFVLADRVKETSNTTGTGTFVLAGPSTGFQSFAVIGDGNTTYYTIQNPGTNEWEVGVGTYYSANTSIVRTTVFSSSNANSVVSFSSGVKDVFVTYPSENAVTTLISNTFTNNQAISVNSASTALVITQAGSGNAFVVEDSTSPDSSPFVIVSTGDVGIGTATPLGVAGTKLDVRGSVTAGANTAGRVSLEQGTSTDSGYVAFWNANLSTRQGYVGYATLAGNSTFNLFSENPTNAVNIGTNGTSRMTITSTGNIGVGTSSPTSKFEIQTTGQNPLTLRTTSTGLYDAATIYLNTSGSTNNQATTLYHGIENASDSTNTTFQIQQRGNSYTYISTKYLIDYKNNFQWWSNSNTSAIQMYLGSAGNLTANLTTTTSGPFDSGTGATWTNPRTIATWAQIELWGAGGGGGGSASGGAGGGGGGGAYFTITVPFSYLGTTETYTVGGGGANVSTNTNGGAGGNTTFTVTNWPGGSKTFTAYGGGGGGGAGSTSGYAGGGGGGTLGVGGSAAATTFGQGGQPTMVQAGGDGNPGYGGAAGGAASGGNAGGAYYGGGGGGGGESGAGTGTTGLGGNSVYGGGGGGGGNDAGTVRNAGGTSVFGGKGGDGGYGNNTTPAQNGTVPGGGGGGSDLGTAGSGNGAGGRVLVTIW